jgi:hypothetical protein
LEEKDLKTDDSMSGDSLAAKLKEINEAKAAIDRRLAEERQDLTLLDNETLILELKDDLASFEGLAELLHIEWKPRNIRGIKAQAREVVRLATEIEKRGFII